MPRAHIAATLQVPILCLALFFLALAACQPLPAVEETPAAAGVVEVESLERSENEPQPTHTPFFPFPGPSPLAPRDTSEAPERRSTLASERVDRVPGSTSTPLPAAAGQPVVNAEPRLEDTLFGSLVKPLAGAAYFRREERARQDPDWGRRIDRLLNAGRINLLLYSYGETHEPPVTERAIIGSYTIISYDLRANRADLISLTHDIRAPEVERVLWKGAKGWTAVRIDQAYEVGGFELMRRTLENATGLSMDFQVSFKETVLQHLIDQVFQGVEVNVPRAFDVHAFYLDGVKYEPGHFPRGRQRLSGKQVLQFIKTVPVTSGAYPNDLEHNVRKHLVFQSMLDSLYQHSADHGFWLRLSAFFAGQSLSGGIAYDFDPVALLVNNIGRTVVDLRSAGRERPLGIPRLGKTRYIVDAAHGDGGVQWVPASAVSNPITQRDIDNGVYPGLAMEVPLNANPYGDLVSEYWPSVRAVVRQALFTPGVTYDPLPALAAGAPPNTAGGPNVHDALCRANGQVPLPWDRVRGIIHPTGERLYFRWTDGEYRNKLEPRYQEQWFDCADAAESAGFRYGRQPKQR